MTQTLQIYLDECQRIMTHAGEPLLPKMRPLGEADWPAVLQSPCQPREALIALKRSNTPMQRPPVGVIGPREATQQQLEIAYALGAGLAELGIPLLCGGRGGVMEAASKGAALKGGEVIGLLPDTSAEAANPWVTLPIASGLGTTPICSVEEALALTAAHLWGVTQPS